MHSYHKNLTFFKSQVILQFNEMTINVISHILTSRLNHTLENKWKLNETFDDLQYVKGTIQEMCFLKVKNITFRSWDISIASCQK